MDLYVIRHGIAQPLGQKNEFADDRRVLTAEGRDRIRDVARALRKLGVQFDLILTSPFTRAVETAEIVAGQVGLSKKEIIPTEHLAPGASRDELFSEIKKHSVAESIALIGHQPDLSELISDIVHSAGSLPIELRKGGVCCLNVTETVPVFHGSVVWLMTPRQLRLLAKL
jgi:phosphohistidine phosphatase